MAGEPELKLLMFRRGGAVKVAACRGLAKGCNVTQKVRGTLGPCEDCVPCDDPNETLEAVMARIRRGNG